MAETTGIGWCDATFNPWWGCERVSPGCGECYAADLAKRYGYADTWSGKGPDAAEHVFRFFADGHWEQPLRWARTMPAKLGRRPRVFCASMADVFEERPELDGPRERLFALIEETPELDWLLLTKRPEAARDLYYAGQWVIGANVWLGTSIENARYTWRADALREVPAPIRFLSAEPLLGPLLDVRPGRNRAPLDLDGIDWLIAGGESGPKARPIRPEWARELRDACVERGLPFYFKQWGGRTAKAGGKVLDGEEWCHFPASLGDLVLA